MEYQFFYNALMGFCSGIVIFIAKHIHGKVDEVSKELSAFKTHVAANHPKHEDISSKFDKVDANINRLADKVDEKFDKVITKIDSIASRRHDDAK